MLNRTLPLITLLSVVTLCAFLFNCSSSSLLEEFKSSRAYKGHENDIDTNNLVNVYPFIIGTKLDDCSTCHTGEIEDGVQIGNACDFCHDYVYRGDGTYTYFDTLNPYGVDYLQAGRSRQAIVQIEKLDSDGDGYSNKEEIMNLRFPGNPNSNPGLPEAATIVLTLQQIQEMESHEQFMLSNASRQLNDEYAWIRGVRVSTLFENLGIDLTGAIGITVSAPDGFQRSYSMEEINMTYPGSIFVSGLDVETIGQDCGFVIYPPYLPEGIQDFEQVPGDLFLMVGYERNGELMEKSYWNRVTGKIEGEGPFRSIIPQKVPGLPDRGQRYSPTNCEDGYDYDSNLDHNAGSMVKGIVAIRIDPMPPGVEEFDYISTGWALIEDEKLVIYGNNIN